jgi:hypothetical protein
VSCAFYSGALRTMKWSDEKSTERSQEREVEVEGGIEEANEGLGHEGRGPRVSPPAACAYHHHIDVILNSHVRSRDRRLSVSVCIL